MNRLAELRERIEKLPPAKAAEYMRELDRLSTRADTDADVRRFVARLERAEYLTGRVHHSAPVRLRGGH